MMIAGRPAPAPPRCPVCKARFRRERTCPRCGADLTPLMVLAAAAFRARSDARAALRAGDFARGRERAAEAQRLCQTPAGRRLADLATFLGHIAAP